MAIAKLRPLFQSRLRWAAGKHCSKDKGAHQSLGENADHCRSYQKWFNPQIQQAGDGPGRIVRVKRAQEQVAGLRRLQRNARGFLISNLSHQDNVWVLPQNRSQASREGDARLGIDLDLVYAVELILNRVLDGNDVLRRRLYPIQGRVKRRAFPLPVGPVTRIIPCARDNID